ncbi:hypothetical protein V3C99_012710 [Haemonchus contortus]
MPVSSSSVQISMNCSDTEDLAKDLRFRVVIGSQALAGIVSFIISSIVLKRCSKLYFHVNCKIMIASMLVIFIIHSIFITTLQGMHLFRYLTISNPCEILVQSSICFSLRYPTTTCTVCMILLELSMIIERAIALWKRSEYDSFGPKIGITLVIASVVVAVLSCAWALNEEDFSQRYAYCSPSTAKTTKNMMILVFVSSGISALTICGVVIVSVFNTFAKRRNRFHLNTSYQIRENESVLRLLLPLDIFQATISGITLISGYVILIFKEHVSVVTFRILLALSNLFPFYTVVTPILLWFIIRLSRSRKADKMDAMKRKQTETENDIYFRTYGEMWGHRR